MIEKIGSPMDATLAAEPSHEIPAAALLVDLLSRLLPITFFVFIIKLKVGDLAAALRGAETMRALGALPFYVEIGSRVSVLLFLILMVLLFAIRAPPRKKAAGFFPRITALLGTFLMSILPILPQADRGIAQMMAGTLLTLLGTLLSVFVLGQLGRSFSIMAEARELVVSGPYSLVRHPLYLTEEIAMLGVLIQFMSVFAALVFLLHLLVQIQRMKNEERVLEQVYPEYSAYRARTARLIPKVY